MAQYATGDMVRIAISEISKTVARSRGIADGAEQTAEVTDVRTQSTILGDVDLYDLTVTDVEGLTLQNVREERIKGAA